MAEKVMGSTALSILAQKATVLPKRHMVQTTVRFIKITHSGEKGLQTQAFLL